MRSVFDELGDNAVLDELAGRAFPERAIRRIRAANVLFRKPFIEIELDSGEVLVRHFERAEFAREWAEARVVLRALTAIELVTDFACPEPANAAQRSAEALAMRNKCIQDCQPMFDNGFYQQYLAQFGPDCRDLPPEITAQLARARRAVDGR